MDSRTHFSIVPEKKNIDSLTPEQELEVQSPHLELLTLRGNSYSKNFFIQLSRSLEKATNLQRVNFNDVFVGRGKDEIPQSLEVFALSIVGKPIMSIDLSNNAVNPYGAEALKPFLRQASFLRMFLINNCGLGIQGVTHIAQGIAEGSHNLEVLAIARNRAEDEGAQQLATALASLKAFRELHIYQNGIKAAGMVPLLKSLTQIDFNTSFRQYCPLLEVLDVRDNFIHPQTAPIMAELILRASRLSALNISDCNLESASNEPILSAIQVSGVVLQRLGYNYAELSDKQGNELLDSLVRQIDRLEKLDIKGNNFKNATKKRYRAVLQEANRSKVLSVFDSDEEDDNDVADELAREFSVLKI